MTSILTRIAIPVFLATLLGCAQAEKQTSDANTQLRAEKMVSDYYGTFASAQFEVDRLMDFYQPDVDFADPTFDIAVRGVDEVRKLYAVAGTGESNYRDLRWKIDTIVASGDNVAIHGLWSGRYQGKPFEVPFVTLWGLRDGRIAIQRDFFAAGLWDRQVDYRPAKAADR